MESDSVDEKEGMELDSQLWQKLPEDLLLNVIAKLPFTRVVAFRQVCKLWCLDIIPRAAFHLEASNGSTLLYFDFLGHDEEKPKWWNDRESRGCPCWMKICEPEKGFPRSMQPWNADIEGVAGSIFEFQQKSLPSPSHDEVLTLRICEQGLLFFGLVTCAHRNRWTGADKKCFRKRCTQRQIVREIFVCNPLTGQSKILGLPCPLWPPVTPIHDRLIGAEVLLGTVFDFQTGSYLLVAGGVNKQGEFLTFLYNSLTCAWTRGPSLLNALSGVGIDVKESRRSLRPSQLLALLRAGIGVKEEALTDGVIKVLTGHARVVCCNNNLYWHAHVEFFDSVGFEIRKEFLLKFDMHLDGGIWRLVPIPNLNWDCRILGRSNQMALIEGKILLWHLHNPRPNRQIAQGHLMDRPCSSGLQLELAPEIKWIQKDMMDWGDVFFGGSDGEQDMMDWEDESFGGSYGVKVDECMAFSRGNFVYHVVKTRSNRNCGVELLKVVTQDIKDNSCNELTLPLNRFPSHDEFSLMTLWSFSASLTTSP